MDPASAFETGNTPSAVALLWRFMLINVNKWEALSPRLSTFLTKPPTAVYLVVNTLTNAADIKAGWAEQSSDGESTVWRNWVVTEKLFIHTEVEFGEENFDSHAETDPMKPRGYYVQPTIRRASAHRLEDVTSLSIGVVGRLSGLQGNWYSIDGATLTFSDGSTVPLPDQSKVDIDERENSELFFADLRQALPI